VGWFTLTGGITGFISGFYLAIFAATQWNLIVGGKPIVSWIPFFVIAFEFTILFAVFGNIAGLVTQVGLPAKIGETYHPACSGSVYGVLAESTPEEADKIRLFFQNRGAITP
jgi:molybdopterin-containing oxidoreductase family membrane subunit